MKSFTTICDCTIGVRAHQPGKGYHDITATIQSPDEPGQQNDPGTEIRIIIIESWGDVESGNTLEEHGNRKIIATESSLAEAVAAATDLAIRAGMDQSLLVQALSQAYAEAYDYLHSGDSD